MPVVLQIMPPGVNGEHGVPAMDVLAARKEQDPAQICQVSAVMPNARLVPTE